MDKMVKINVTERCAKVINDLNDSQTEDRSTRINAIANSFSCLVELLQAGRDEEVFPGFCNGIINVMECVNEYYVMVKSLTYDLYNREDCMYILKDEREK